MHMKKNTTFILKIAIFVGVIFVADSVFATAPPPSPTCKIEGEIISSAFKEASKNICVSEGNCPTDTLLQFPARQEIKVKISKVSYVGGDTSVMKCEDMYQVGTTGDYWIMQNNIVNGDKFTSGKLITTSVNGGTSRGNISTYSLKSKENTTTTTITTVTTEISNNPTDNNTIEPSKISEKIISDQSVDSVQSITLSSDKKTYVIEAVKTGKLLMLFKVDMDVEVTIDALTGEVSKINKPWWSFLVTF